MRNIEDLESMPEFKCGLWYSPYVKIYTIGWHNRIAEISNYPRAYKDTTSHVYTEDTTLIEDGKEVICHKGDPLPGAFPLWVERADIPFAPNLDEHIFPLSDVPSPIKSLSEAQQRVGDTFVGLPTLTAMRGGLSTGKITLARKAGDSDKQVIRIKYQRVF